MRNPSLIMEQIINIMDSRIRGNDEFISFHFLSHSALDAESIINHGIDSCLRRNDGGKNTHQSRDSRLRGNDQQF